MSVKLSAKLISVGSLYKFAMVLIQQDEGFGERITAAALSNNLICFQFW